MPPAEKYSLKYFFYFSAFIGQGVFFKLSHKSIFIRSTTIDLPQRYFGGIKKPRGLPREGFLEGKLRDGASFLLDSGELFDEDDGN